MSQTTLAPIGAVGVDHHTRQQAAARIPVRVRRSLVRTEPRAQHTRRRRDTQGVRVPRRLHQGSQPLDRRRGRRPRGHRDHPAVRTLERPHHVEARQTAPVDPGRRARRHGGRRSARLLRGALAGHRRLGDRSDGLRRDERRRARAAGRPDPHAHPGAGICRGEHRERGRPHLRRAHDRGAAERPAMDVVHRAGRDRHHLQRAPLLPPARHRPHREAGAVEVVRRPFDLLAEPGEVSRLLLGMGLPTSRHDVDLHRLGVPAVLHHRPAARFRRRRPPGSTPRSSSHSRSPAS